MSGHSKWSQIKRKKEVKDKEKGKIFSKLARLITLAVTDGGGSPDPNLNVKLRLAIEKAKAANMPKSNIESAIVKGTGPEKDSLKEIFYEGFGPNKVALIIQTTTDNSNRTISEVRSALERSGGKLGTTGSVSYLFQRCARVDFDKKENNMDEILSFAEKVAAFDIEEEGDTVSIYFPFEYTGKAHDALSTLKPLSVPEIDFKPKTLVKVEDKKESERLLKLIDAVEALEDVQGVFANFDLPEAYLQP